MTPTELRRQKQVAFLESDQNIIIGSLVDFPLRIEDVLAMTEDSPFVVQKIESGLTSLNYNIQVQGNKYNIKVKRQKILVSNLDGQTSFLNEIQRRYELEEIRKTNPMLDKGIVKTIYANLHEGIIISNFIDGVHPENYEERDLENFFNVLFHLDTNGFFEWDLCKGNIMKEGSQFILFDFGYMYRFNPLKEFNSEGLNAPNFHPIERFETRHYLHVLRDLEESVSKGKYRVLKRLTKDYFNRKVEFLLDHNADEVVIKHYQSLIQHLGNILMDNRALEVHYISDMYRATALDIEDDISGKSCTKYTLEKVAYMKKLIQNEYTLLSSNNVFLHEDRLSQSDLLNRYQDLEKLVYTYML